jgi:hypothetical protein
MESIDTTSVDIAIQPTTVLVEQRVPGSKDKEFLPIRLYNPRLIPTDKDKIKEPTANEHPLKIHADQKVEFNKIRRDDLLFHQDHGYLSVQDIQAEEDRAPDGTITRTVSMVEC